MTNQEDYPEPPRTDNLELALLSEAEDAEDYRDLWGRVLDEEVFKKLEAKLTEGEADLDVSSVSAEEIATSDIEARTDQQVIYVRENGDDSNSGTSTDDALASLSAAKEELTELPIPKNSVSPTHIIDIGAGETIVLNEPLEFGDPFRSYIRIRSSSSTNRSTIDVQNDSSGGITATGAKLEFRHIRVTSSREPPIRALRALEGASLYLRGQCYVTGGTNRQIDARENSYVNVMSDTVIEGNGKSGSANGLSTHSASFGNMSGTIQNCNVGLYATRNGLMSASGTIDNCNIGVKTRDGPQFKMIRSTVTNCNVAYQAGRNSQISIIENTTAGNGTLYKQIDPTSIINRDDADLVYVGTGERTDYRDPDNNYVATMFDDRMDWRETPVRTRPQDVRALNGAQGDQAYHDGSGSNNTEGPAFYNGMDWISLVDGSTIS